MRLEPASEGTKLLWDADAQVSGKLAQIGSRLINSTAHMMAGQFFDRFEQLLAGQKVEDKPMPMSAFVPTWAWIIGWALLFALVVIIYFLVV